MRTTALISAIILGLIPSTVAAPALEASTANIVAKFGKDLTANNYYGAPSPPWYPNSKPGWYYGSHPEKSPGTPSLNQHTCKWLDHYPQAIHCPHSYPPPHMHHSLPHPPPPVSHTTEVGTKFTPTTPSLSYTTHPSDSPTSSVYAPPVYSTDTTRVYTPSEYDTATLPETTPTPTYYLLSPSPGGYSQTFSNITAAVQADDYMTFGMVDTVDGCTAMCNSVEGCSFANTYHDVNGKNGSPLLTCALFTQCHGPEDADNRGGQIQPDGSINYIANSDGWCKN